MCNEEITPFTNYVFILNTYGSQQDIEHFLQSAIPHSAIAEADDYCRKQIRRILCNYYLIPCGNVTSKHPPSSICAEECSLVQETCSSLWEAVRLPLDALLPFINCSDASSSLIPLSNCCTGVGIEKVPGKRHVWRVHELLTLDPFIYCLLVLTSN